jgi:uncharacterized membrane protein YdjX (TVP38/TMEM64 family)
VLAAAVNGRTAPSARTAANARTAVSAAALLLLTACRGLPEPEEANRALMLLHDYDRWGWAIGILLIWADVLLPIPQTAVVAALGIVYGTWLGGAIGAVGLVSGGLLGYALMRTAAGRFAHRFIAPRRREKMERLFEQGGAWAIILTRSLPYSVPEAMTLLAGLARMPIRGFTTSLVLGSVPTAFVFAAVGAGWADQPLLALSVSYVVPIPLLPLALYLVRRRAERR